MKEWIISGWLHILVAAVITYVVVKRPAFIMDKLSALWAWVKDQYEALKAKV